MTIDAINKSTVTYLLGLMKNVTTHHKPELVVRATPALHICSFVNILCTTSTAYIG
jgi:hypothetical protein